MARAKGYTDDVEFSAEDATRSDAEFLEQVYAPPSTAGATTCNVPDTVGYMLPDAFAELVSWLIAETPGADRAIWSVHCHDDLGVAVANSLSAVQAGARQVEVAVNGIGERAGNCSMEEVVMALRTHQSTLGVHDRGRHPRDRPHLPAGQPAHRLPDPAQQGDRRGQRLRPRVRHPPARRADGADHLRAHGPGRARLRRVADRARQALRPPRRSPTPSRKLGFDLSREELDKAFTRFKELADRKAPHHRRRPGGAGRRRGPGRRAPPGGSSGSRWPAGR